MAASEHLRTAAAFPHRWLLQTTPRPRVGASRSDATLLHPAPGHHQICPLACARIFQSRGCPGLSLEVLKRGRHPSAFQIEHASTRFPFPIQSCSPLRAYGIQRCYRRVQDPVDGSHREDEQATGDQKEEASERLRGRAVSPSTVSPRNPWDVAGTPAGFAFSCSVAAAYRLTMSRISNAGEMTSCPRLRPPAVPAFPSSPPPCGTTPSTLRPVKISTGSQKGGRKRNRGKDKVGGARSPE